MNHHSDSRRTRVWSSIDLCVFFFTIVKHNVSKCVCILFANFCVYLRLGPLQASSIRDVIAFPKSNAGRCLMTDAPGELDAAQHAEYHISVAPPKGKDASSSSWSSSSWSSSSVDEAKPSKKAERAVKESAHKQQSPTAL